jgi:hypothetical protein
LLYILCPCAVFLPVSLPLASLLAPARPAGAQWAHEIKHGGYRFIMRRDGDCARVQPARPRLDSRAFQQSSKLCTRCARRRRCSMVAREGRAFFCSLCFLDYGTVAAVG